MRTTNQHNINPHDILDKLKPADVRTISFREYSSRRKALVEIAWETFRKGETRLEELLGEGRLNEKHKKHVFREMEEHILRLRTYKLEDDARKLAREYTRIQQQYERYPVN